MSTDITATLAEALDYAQAGLRWYHDMYPEQVEECDHEAMAEIDAALSAYRQHTEAQAAAVGGETLYLVHSGGDGYRAEIVPESKLDDAYLLTQWVSLDDIDPAQRAAALEHFHDGDSWTHEEDSGQGRWIKFGLSLEDGWIEVVRLPEFATPAPVEQAAQPVALTDEQITRGALTDGIAVFATLAAAYKGGVRFAERAHGIGIRPAGGEGSGDAI